jgi:hypothetical protein
MDTTEPIGTLTLIGSGEMSRSMGRVHRSVMARIPEPVRPVFLDTPAGFELNADDISARAVAYFGQRLDADLEVASFKSAAKATKQEIDRVLTKLRGANYIFAGPGSPTYVVKNWRDTVVFEAITRRFAAGAHLVLASSAAIAVGRYALPVYEIFKVGEPPYWAKGLDLLGPFGLDLAIIPHWNNGEGGTYDTRFCFVGAPRFAVLETLLPETTTILGIDEYTACILDPFNDEARVAGAGQVTIRKGEESSTYPDDARFPLSELRRGAESGDEMAQTPICASRPALATGLYYNLPPDWDKGSGSRDHGVSVADPFIQLLIDLRAQLREMENWELADEMRERLQDMGVALEDGPEQTTWTWC